jgi:hypothetical protein
MSDLFRRMCADDAPVQPDAIPWGWWDIAHVVALLLVNLVFIFLVYGSSGLAVEAPRCRVAHPVEIVQNPALTHT